MPARERPVPCGLGRVGAGGEQDGQQVRPGLDSGEGEGEGGGEGEGEGLGLGFGFGLGRSLSP